MNWLKFFGLSLGEFASNLNKWKISFRANNGGDGTNFIMHLIVGLSYCCHLKGKIIKMKTLKIVNPMEMQADK